MQGARTPSAFTETVLEKTYFSIKLFCEIILKLKSLWKRKHTEPHMSSHICLNSGIYFSAGATVKSSLQVIGTQLPIH